VHPVGRLESVNWPTLMPSISVSPPEKSPDKSPEDGMLENLSLLANYTVGYSGRDFKLN
jgi:hypothetical protein